MTKQTEKKQFKSVQILVDISPDKERGFVAHVAVIVNDDHDDHTDQLFFNSSWEKAHEFAAKHGARVARLLLDCPENPPRNESISLKGSALVDQYHGCGRGWVEFDGKTEIAPPIRMRYADTLDDEGSERQDDYLECVDEDGCLTGADGGKVPAPQRTGARKIVGGRLRVYGNFSCWYFFYYLPELKVV